LPPVGVVEGGAHAAYAYEMPMLKTRARRRVRIEFKKFMIVWLIS